MQIVLLSDTHGELMKTQEVVALYAQADQYIHLGDVGFAVASIPNFLIVKGNHDQDKRLSSEVILTCEKCRILCLHGHQFDEETVAEVMKLQHLDGVDMLQQCMEIVYRKLSAYAKEKQCDTVFFGHSHLPCDRMYEGIRLINPGSLCYGLQGSSYAIVDIEGKEINVHLHPCMLKDDEFE